MSPKFSSVRSTASRFQDIAHFMIFPLTLMLEFQSFIKFEKIQVFKNLKKKVCVMMLKTKKSGKKFKRSGRDLWKE